MCVCGIIYFNFVHIIIRLHKLGLGLPYILFLDPKISVWVAFFTTYKCRFLGLLHIIMILKIQKDISTTSLGNM